MKIANIAFLIIALLLSCAKPQDNFIPYVPVRFNANLNDPRLLLLKSVGGAVVLPDYGYAGLILYKRGENDIVAYDRCSTVNPENKCAVNLDNPTITVTDPCSGAKYLLSDGSAAKAPAVRPLQRYQVNISNNNSIFVTNY